MAHAALPTRTQRGTVVCVNERAAVLPKTIDHSINWVALALNADWLKGVVYQPVNHRYDKTFIFTALITLVTSL